MKYLFGPVNSRRLGLSQGIDLIPTGACNFKCIYCEVQQNKRLTTSRREYSPTDEIIAEIDTIFENTEKANSIDAYTITASGEPTLHSGIQDVISSIKRRTDKPVTVLTNGGLLYLQEVRESLAGADIVVPSLDSARTESFLKINRPEKNTCLENIIAGIAQFRKEFSGQLWLEVLMVHNINDQPEDIDALKKAIALIDPDKIQLNTVVRPPFETFASRTPATKLQEIANELANKVEIIAPFVKKDKQISDNATPAKVIELLRRRPGTTLDISEALQAPPEKVQILLNTLAQDNKVKRILHASSNYWIARENLKKERHA